jgi:hypothetical protein
MNRHNKAAAECVIKDDEVNLRRAIGGFDQMIAYFFEMKQKTIKFIPKNMGLVDLYVANMADNAQFNALSVKCSYYHERMPGLSEKGDDIPLENKVTSSSGGVRFEHDIARFDNQYIFKEMLLFDPANEESDPTVTIHASPSLFYCGHDYQQADKLAVFVFCPNEDAKEKAKLFKYDKGLYKVEARTYDVMITPKMRIYEGTFKTMLNDMILVVNHALKEVSDNASQIKLVPVTDIM